MAVNSTALREEVHRRAAAAFLEACDEMVLFTRAETPVDTGATRDSAQVEIGSVDPPLLTATLTADTPQARYTDEGTGPHVIEGNPWLVFEVGGRTVVVRSVNHPGSTKHVGWFSERTASEQRWADALLSAWARTG